jgi:hypothetical protein
LAVVGPVAPADLRSRTAGQRRPRHLRSLSITRELQANAFAFTGDLETALAHRREALYLRERLAAGDPLNVDYQRLLGVSAYYNGEVLAAMGPTDGAKNATVASRRPRTASPVLSGGSTGSRSRRCSKSSTRTKL